MNAIHQKIQQLRNIRKFTQREMAEKLGMELKTYKELENALTILDYASLKAVANALTVEVEDLIIAEETGVYIIAKKDYKLDNEQEEDGISTASPGDPKFLKELIAIQDEEIAKLIGFNKKLVGLLENPDPSYIVDNQAEDK